MGVPVAEMSAYAESFAWAANDPELGPLLRDYADGKYNDQTLQAAIQNTKWWRDKQDARKQWETLLNTDPAEAQHRRDAQREKIEKYARTLGVTLPPDVLDNFADSSLRYQWSDIQLDNAVLGYFHYQPGKTTGQAATLEQQLRASASDYGITVTDDSMQGWIVSIEQGRNSVDTFKAWAAQQSANLNPWAKAGLDTGLTLRQIIDPIVSKVADELEVNPNMINLSDGKWTRIFQASRDPKTGAFVMPAWSDVERLIRSDPQYGWDRTQKANETVANGGVSLLQTFGRVA